MIVHLFNLLFFFFENVMLVCCHGEVCCLLLLLLLLLQLLRWWPACWFPRTDSTCLLGRCCAIFIPTFFALCWLPLCTRHWCMRYSYCTALHVPGRLHGRSFYLFLSIITHLPLQYSSCPEHYCHAVHLYSFIIWLLMVCLCVRVLKILHNCASIFWLTRHFFLLVLINCPCSFHYQVNTNPRKFSSTTTTPTTTLVLRTNYIIRSNQFLVLSWR